MHSDVKNALIFRGGIANQGLDDIASAPRGVYSSGATTYSNYNIPAYSTIYKYNGTSFVGSFCIRRADGEGQTAMYVYDGYTKTFRKLAFA